VGVFKRLGLVLLFLIVVAAGISVTKRFLEVKKSPPIDRSKIRVRVFNGSGVKYQGRRTAMFLRSLGFDVWDIYDTKEGFKNTMVIEHTDPSLLNAKEVAKAIHYKRKIIKELDSLLYIDVTVIVGKDYKKFFPDTGL